MISHQSFGAYYTRVRIIFEFLRPYLRHRRLQRMHSHLLVLHIRSTVTTHHRTKHSQTCHSLSDLTQSDGQQEGIQSVQELSSC